VAGLYNGVFTMWDDVTNSAWSHLDGRAIAGPLAGQALDVRPLQTTTWGAWRAAHPDTTAARPVPGAAYFNVPRLGDDRLSDAFLETLPVGLDGRLPANALVVGVLAASEARAFPIEERPPAAPFQDEVGGVPVVILEDRDGTPVLAYHRALSDGRVLDFERRDDGVYDTQTGSRWEASGIAAGGALQGVALTFVTSFVTEYYGWWAFHPYTTIHGQD
jgi:hypothetical protein